jgi:hypothetical protein
VKSFGDLLGVASVSQGGTGATNIPDAKRNLLLHEVATTGNFRDLNNIPYIISQMSNVGGAVPIISGIINGVATVRTLTGSDQTIAVGLGTGGSTIDLCVGSIPVGKLTGVLEPENGGTGLGSSQMATASPGNVLTVTPNHRWAPQAFFPGHIIADGHTVMAQRSILRFKGSFLELTDDGGATVVHINDYDPGHVVDYSISMEDFISNKATINGGELSLSISYRLLLQTRDHGGHYIECGIRLFPGPNSHIEITGEPFDGHVLLYDGWESRSERFAAIPFAAGQFSNGVCVISRTGFNFDAERAIVQCLFNQGGYYEYVHVGLVLTADGDVKIHSGVAFNGVLVIVGDPSDTDNYATTSFFASDFDGNGLILAPGDFPFPLIRPLISIQKSSGEWINASVRVQNRGNIYIHAEPFTGSISVLQGIRVLVPKQLQIVDPANDVMPYEPQLRFAGRAEITDSPQTGQTIVNIEDQPLPISMAGDLIVGVRPGEGEALAIGAQNQVLMVDDGFPAWKDVGNAAFVDVDVPGGAVLLDEGGQIPSAYLPLGSMSYKGTFGSASSTTGGDLPLTPEDGDIYDCIAEEDYASAVAGIIFHPAQQAIYVLDLGWVARPMAGSDPTKANADASNISDDDAAAWQDRLNTPSLARRDASNLTADNATAWKDRLDIASLAQRDASNISDANATTWKERLDTASLARRDASNLAAADQVNWASALGLGTKADTNAANLSSQNVSAWQTKLGVNVDTGGEYETVAFGTVYAPETYDRMVIIARTPAGHASQTISIGDSGSTVNQIIARTSAITDRAVAFFSCAKVPAGKYFRADWDGNYYNEDYNFMIRM